MRREELELARRVAQLERRLDDLVRPERAARGATRYEWCPASGLQAPGAKPASAVTRTVGMAWAFSDGQEEEIRGNIKLPDLLDRDETVTFCLGWSSPATSANCDWEIDYLLTAAGEDTDGAADATMQDYVASSGTADGLVMTTWTGDAFSVGASDVCVHFTIRRDGNDGSDALGDVAHVHGVALVYTAK